MEYKVKNRLHRELFDEKYTEADLQLLESKAPALPLLRKFRFSPRRFAQDILYTLLDFATAEEIVSNRKPADNEFTKDDFGSRINIEESDFPKDIPAEDIIEKTQKGGKKSDSEKVAVALVGNDLYVKRHTRDSQRNVEIRISDATNYTAEEIIYRLELGIGSSTDAVRLIGDAIRELFQKKDLGINRQSTDLKPLSIGQGTQSTDPDNESTDQGNEPFLRAHENEPKDEPKDDPKEKDDEIADLAGRTDDLTNRTDDIADRLEDVENRIQDAESRIEDAENRAEEAETRADEAEAALEEEKKSTDKPKKSEAKKVARKSKSGKSIPK